MPGLKMVIPSGPRTARALLVAAIRDPDPVVFFEHKALYHASKEEVPDESEATIPRCWSRFKAWRSRRRKRSRRRTA